MTPFELLCQAILEGRVRLVGTLQTDPRYGSIDHLSIQIIVDPPKEAETL